MAICGIAVRLPGGISNDAQLWDFLLAKRDARSQVPGSRYNISGYHSDSGKHGTSKSKYGYFLDESVDLGTLDTSFFSFTKLELEYIDPCQRQLLEVVRECFESAGEVNYRGKDIGCFVGSFGDDWTENLTHDEQTSAKYPLMVGGDFATPNRVSYEYNLHGPSVSIRTACSSSLVALHSACLSIQNGDCSAAIVAGFNLILTPTMTMIMSSKGVLSADGSSKSFDADADGYGRGEAVNAVYIKPLHDAIRDGNPIRAVIRGTATNSDGKSAGFTVPSADAQEDVIRKAYKAAGISDLSQTAFVECHGTGTTVGDPIEVAAIANTFGGDMYIGSVKPNVGHSEGASGLTSLIKAVLAVENRTIPPNIKFNTPNPKIPFEAKKITVPVEATPWPWNRCVRASVNSFGMGGVNAHVIIESADNFTPPTSEVIEEHDSTPQLLLFSANTQDSLEAMIQRNLAYLRENTDSLRDLVYTMGARREHLSFRAASIVHSDMSVTTASFGKAPSSPPDIVMVFAGQGAQWPGMGVELFKSNATFRRSILEMDSVLQSLPDAPAWSIADEISKEHQTSMLYLSSYSQPICTALQVALVNTLFELNIRPYAVIGHSSGELAAAYAAGRLTASQAVTLAYYRGIVAGKVAQAGYYPFLRPGVVVACENSPSSVTISGDIDQVQYVMQEISLAHPEILCRQIKSDTAYHSHHMKSVGDTYHSFINPFFRGETEVNCQPVHFFSTVTGDELSDGDHVGPKYWQQNLESRVLFQGALENIISRQRSRHLLFLDVSPHSTLAGPIRQTLEQAEVAHPYVPCLIRFKNCAESFLSTIGQLYSHRQPLDFNMLTNPDRTAKVLTDVPTYPWQHGYSNLYTTRQNNEWLFRKQPKHELLGTRVVDSTDNEPCWRNVLYLEHVTWLRDHKVSGNIVFPAAGYVMMAGEAVRQIGSTASGFIVRQMVLDTAMVLNQSNPTEIVTSLRKHRRDRWYSFTISSHNGVKWIEHCYGEVAQENLSRDINVSNWYKTLSRGGVEFGPAFQCVESQSCSVTSNTVSGRIVSKLDSVLHIVYGAIYKGFDWQVESLPVPTSIGEIMIGECVSDLDVTMWADVSRNSNILVNGEAFGSDGCLLIRIKDIVLRPLGANQACFEEDESHAGARLLWKPSMQFLNLADLIQTPVNWTKQTMLLNDFTSLCIERALCLLHAQGDWLQRQPKPSSEQSMESLVEKILATSAAPCARAMIKVLDNIVPICKGEIDALEVLMGDDTLYELYNYLNEPQQRILEIGAGTGGTTAKILPRTKYSTYTFTDISAAFFPAAKDRFQCHANVVYRTLDITKDPLDQANVLHATPNLYETLSNLLLEELCGDAKFTNFIVGVLPGWWAGESDGRADEPYISPDRWDSILKAAAPPLHSLAFMLASPSCVPESPLKRNVTLLSDVTSSEIAVRMQKQLLSRGYSVGVQSLDQSLMDGEDVIILVDTVSPFFHNLDSRKLSTFQNLLRELQRSHSGALWVTRSIQIDCRDPRYSPTLGVARTVRSEFGLDFGTCEVDTLKYTSIGLVIDVFEAFHGRRHGQNAYPEYEYAIREDTADAGQQVQLLGDDEVELQVDTAGVNFLTVLINSASDGVGLAAIQISKMIGATIYATVIGEDKVEYLTASHGIPRDHIFNSRDSSFLDGIMRVTNGRGVDLVLTSLSADFIQASCDCVANFGKLVNLSKPTAANQGQFPIDSFHPNMSYASVDIIDYIKRRPKESKRLLEEIVELYKQGHIQPITPVKTFTATDIRQCFDYMQSGQHIGQLRLSLKSQDTFIEAVCSPKTMIFQSDASYLLVGGLGGLGAEIARWMAEHGARNLIFLSRSADAESNIRLFRELESQGCSVQAIKGSVCNASDVKRAISAARIKLKGIFNMSMVLQDASLLKMSSDEWNAATGPKIQGTWNLHDASLDQDLDFFLLFSSMGGILGIPGQANYASANTFMDAFVQFRHSSHLPASVIDIGEVQGIGHVANNPEILNRLKLLECARMSQKDLFHAITIAISHSLPPQTLDYSRYENPAQFITGLRDTTGMLDSTGGKSMLLDSRLAAYVGNSAAVTAPTETKTSANKLNNFVSSAATDSAILSEPSATQFVSLEIARWVFDLLMKPVDDDSEIDLSRSLVDVGLDSLAAVEMRSWLKSSLGLDISVLEIMASPSLAAMGEHVIRELVRKFGGDNKN
ncbi:KR domain-containing protein [Paecilomyces variotii]|uniref:Highly reducing polyketide synthase VdtX n=1 Tax=Byssochlamys spectabilis TaxID=264951 RepID=VDTX1_BYSSP|nr:KR domain-containing protein [Paecilomyces variotii]A0A443HK66.1 RecName: Full=Highly reducing polyketide synthase VdtX; Short=HR-PKS VdtX; AltName: Full=Viriditoxin biosynthesis cluster protein X [Paecilomyces variotii]RWQ92174.1 KR domain-containing protein [Paecilomyces variotii]